MKKAQTASFDAIIAVALFVIALIFFFTFSSGDTYRKGVENLDAESGKLASSISGRQNESGSFITGTKVDEEKLADVSNMSYQQLKDFFGLGADFCIYFEDSEGNIVNVSGNKTGIGSPVAVVNGTGCG